MLREDQAIEGALHRLDGVDLRIGELALIAPRPEQAGRSQTADVDVVRRRDRPHELGAGGREGARRVPLESARPLLAAAVHQSIERVGVGRLEQRVQDVGDGQRGHRLAMLAREQPLRQIAGRAHRVDIVCARPVGPQIIHAAGNGEAPVLLALREMGDPHGPALGANEEEDVAVVVPGHAGVGVASGALGDRLVAREDGAAQGEPRVNPDLAAAHLLHQIAHAPLGLGLDGVGDHEHALGVRAREGLELLGFGE